MPGSAVVVVGSVNVDLVVVADRLPTRGETVLGRRLERHGGGKGANAAVAAARLGAETRLVAAVGDDTLGEEAVGELRREGVDVSGVTTVEAEATGAALIVVDAGGENQIAVGSGANAALEAGAVAGALARLLPGAGAVLVSLEVPDGAVAAAVEAGRARRVPVVVNPAPARPAVLDLAAHGPILTPNAGEARELSGEEEPEAAARTLAERTGAPVLVTLGADGVLVLDGGTAERLPAPAVTAVDTTGAGDAFNGALAVALAEGRPLREAAAFAVAAAALSTRAHGAREGMPRRDEVRG